MTDKRIKEILNSHHKDIWTNEAVLSAMKEAMREESIEVLEFVNDDTYIYGDWGSGGFKYSAEELYNEYLKTSIQ